MGDSGIKSVDGQATGAQPLVGRYKIWPADRDGKLLTRDGSGKPPPADEAPDPNQKDAVEIGFGLRPSADMPPRKQLELQTAVDKVLRVIQRIYADPARGRSAAFRMYYVRLFNVARIGLEGMTPSPELAQLELAKITADLLDDEGGNFKNAHMRTLGKYAARYSLLPLLVYALVSLFPGNALRDMLAALRVDTDWLASFCMLWVGCFNGVWLSYGIRKTRITLSDMLVGDEDRMQPQIRLLFAASLASAIGLTFALGIVDVELGPMALSDITSSPALAFLVGLLLGVSELALPASVGNRASSLAAALK